MVISKSHLQDFVHFFLCNSVIYIFTHYLFVLNAAGLVHYKIYFYQYFQLYYLSIVLPLRIKLHFPLSHAINLKEMINSLHANAMTKYI